MSNHKESVEYFIDASSDEAKAFVVASTADEVFVRSLVAEIDERIAALGDVSHALRVLAHQARELWATKVPAWQFTVIAPDLLPPQYLRPDEERIREDIAEQLKKYPSEKPVIPGVVFKRTG